MKIKLLLILIVLGFNIDATAQLPQTYDLWLHYSFIEDVDLRKEYQVATARIYFPAEEEIARTAKVELSRGLSKMLDYMPRFSDQMDSSNLLVARFDELPENVKVQIPALSQLNKEGFIIRSILNKGESKIILTAHDDKGILYGVFHFLRHMQSRQLLNSIDLAESPKINLRLLNHWDNLDRSVERGYAGFSLWNWHKLPDYIDQRYIDYARANASVGINGTVLNNVNANALILTPMYLEKVAALANTLRPYGIKVYLSARFSAPIQIGGLKTADPLDLAVRKWWLEKANEIYALIPDFGGFLVKANSEGQPGPHDYGRSHGDGANMLATALEPHGGVVIWRAFVYSEHDATDRAKQAFAEFVPFDRQFKDNVLIQVKNGPIDFQGREPFHPMFGAMPNTSLMMEFQITQEYLGFSSHLVFLPKLYEEVLDANTYRSENNSSVAHVIDGSLHGANLTGMAGVANIGTDLNWCGHPFAQANWYGFGRLAWDPLLSSETIAEEWLKATFNLDTNFINPIKKMMLVSREAVVNYMNPLGLHHIFNTGHHYGPGPWVGNLSRPEWNPVYYHQADSAGIGFNRSRRGSNGVGQYAEPLANILNDPVSCPEEYLLWFHHLPWDYTLKNGQTLWDGLALKYQEGVDQVKYMIEVWNSKKPYVSKQQYNEVRMLLDIQLKEARWWKDACLVYFQTFSGRDFPAKIEKPTQSLEYFKSLAFPFAPGIRPRWR